jgi:hypothetical protein
MQDTVIKINHRLFKEDDKEGIFQLWENDSKWGPIHSTIFDHWVQTPYGKCIIVIAEDEVGRVIGQMIFTPTRVYVRNRTVNALRISAPIIRSDYRFSSSELCDNPLYGMFCYGMKIAIERRFSLVYIFPAKGWLRAIHAISNQDIFWQTATYNGFSIPLNPIVESPFANDPDVIVTLASDFSVEYDELWNDAIRLFPIHCAIVRNRKWLQYRLGGHLTFETRNKNDGKLLGYCSVKKSTGLLVDMLARDRTVLLKTLVSATKLLHHLNATSGSVPIEKITGMRTPLIDEFEASLPVHSLNYKFDFGCAVLDNSINLADVKPEMWHMMPDV